MRESDQGMVEQARRVYAPEPLGQGRRAALRAAIDARVQRPRHHWLVAAALVATVVLALVALLAHHPAPTPEVSTGHSNDRWIEDVLFGGEQEEISVPLPAEYAALSELLER